MKTSIYHLLFFIKILDIHSNGVASIDFPANGVNFISSNGRAFGFNETGPLDVEKSKLATMRVTKTVSATNPYPGWFISYLNKPAVDIPSGVASQYTGDFSIYIKAFNGSAIVLGCTSGGSSAQPTMTASFKGDVSSGSWYFKHFLNARYGIACATKYKRTNFCISTPTDGKPKLVNCDENDLSQRFHGIQVKSL